MKNGIKYCLMFALAAFFSAGVSGQTVINPNAPYDSPYLKEHINQRKPIPYTYLREADVMFAKRIWRVIDMREKINLPLYYPTEPIKNRLCLFDVIRKGLEEGALHAYDRPAIDDEFQYEMPLSLVKSKLNSMDTVLTPNINTGLMDTVLVPRQIDAAKITQFWVKEDWFFDKQRSVMEVRIIGIAPMVEKIDQNGDFRGYEPLFWVYFPECRPYFAQYEVFNRFNDAERRTFDDIFHKRLFSSYIRKESNVYDRVIVEYAKSIDALFESDRIKNDLFLMEHDMWHF
ncbi:MAG: gliding motility protein GldN [Bacteroidia bacterium]|nr:gliding motility protein GldN [Bacteroidia bacterium]